MRCWMNPVFRSWCSWAGLLIAVFLVGFLSQPIVAQGGDGLYGEYFNSKTLAGSVIRTRIDPQIDFDFNYDSPLTGVSSDNFSIRWTGQLQAPVTGTYTFTTYSDDGVRLYINGVKVLDNWTDHAPTYNDSAPLTLIAGNKYDIRLEYFEGVLGAQVHLYWSYPGSSRDIIPTANLFSLHAPAIGTPLKGSGTGLRAEYYQNIDMSGSPVLTRTDSTVNFNWGQAAPAAGMYSDYFSVRWTGKVFFPVTGNFTFTTESDDGIRLYLNNKLVVGNWTYHGATLNSSESYPGVAGTTVDIRLEYFESSGDAVARLHWSYPGQADQAIPQQYLIPASTSYLPGTVPLLTSNSATMDASRFLQQASYGPSAAEIQDVLSKGYDAWLTEQFAIAPTSHQSYLYAIRDAGGKIYNEQARESFWTQALKGKDQLRQRVVFALSEILVISELGGMLDNQPYALASYLDTLGNNAFGNFRQLLEEVTLSPTMGRYLDMLGNEKEDPSVGRTPNENYAREILQLFSIGLYQLNLDGSLKRDSLGNPIPTYGQDEIKGFARVFTGWNWGGNSNRADSNWDFPPVQYQWNFPMQAWPTRHSTGTKQVLGAVIPDGQTPEKDLKDALDNIFNHPNVGPFISRQLIQRLVTSNPSSAYVARVASVFNDNGSGVRGDLKAVVRAILLDTEARGSRAAYGSTRSGTSRGPGSGSEPAPKSVGKLREPMLRWSHLLRAFGVEAQADKFRIWYVDSPTDALGQSPLRSPTVFNYFEPSYALPGRIASTGVVSPEFKLANETTVIALSNFFLGTIYNGYGDWTGYATQLNFTPYLSIAGNSKVLVEQLNLVLMAGTMSDTMKNAVVEAINQTDAMYPGERLRSAIFLITTSSEYAVQK